MNKKILAALLALSMTLALASCGGDNGKTGSSTDASGASAAASEEPVSSEETPTGNKLTDAEIKAILAEVELSKSTETGDAKMSMDMTMDMGGISMKVTMSSVVKIKGSGDTLEKYTENEMNYAGKSNSKQIEYYKDGKTYYIQYEEGDKTGYYMEGLPEENEEDEEIDISEEEVIDGIDEESLREATVEREDGLRKINIPELGDKMKDSMLKSAGVEDSGVKIDIERCEAILTVTDDNKLSNITIGLTFRVESDDETSSEGVQSIAYDINLVVELISYGDDAKVTITPPEGIEDLPSFEEYLADAGDDWDLDDWEDIEIA